MKFIVLFGKTSSSFVIGLASLQANIFKICRLVAHLQHILAVPPYFLTVNHRNSSTFQEQGKLNWLSLSKAHMLLIWKPNVVLNFFISRLEGGSIFFSWKGDCVLERLCVREVWDQAMETWQARFSPPSLQSMLWLDGLPKAHGLDM